MAETALVALPTDLRFLLKNQIRSVHIMLMNIQLLRAIFSDPKPTDISLKIWGQGHLRLSEAMAEKALI